MFHFGKIIIKSIFDKNELIMKKILSLCVLALFLSPGLLQGQKLTKNKKQLLKSIAKHEANLIEISDKIWSLAETAFEENASAKF